VRLRHPGASLDVLGSGSEEQALRDWVRERDLGGICFRGAVAHERVPEYLDRADILLNPTNVDNMPLTLLEAFASGVAVVTTNAGGIPDLVGDSGAALQVAADDAPGMAAMVLDLIADPALAERTIAAARQVAEKYGWPDVRTTLLQAYYPDVEFPTTSTAVESKPL
jgi:glycosyltransferase involved in cell wall biosynthesis